MKKRIVSTMLIGLLTASVIFTGCSKKEVQQTAEEYLAKAENGELSDEDIDLIRENLGEEAASQVAGINEKMKAVNESAAAGSDDVVAKAESKAAETGSENKAPTESKAATESSSASTASSEATTASSAQAESKATTESKAATESSSASTASSEAAKKAAEEAAAKKAVQEKAAQEARAAEQVAVAAQALAEQRAAQEQSATASTDFIDYLNQKRAEAGLSSIAWDGDIAGEAERRAAELINDMSHNGCPDDCAEIIATANPDTSIASVYSQWYSSSGHRAIMMDNRYDKGAYASAVHDGTRYVVALFSATPTGRDATPEENAAIDEAMKDAVEVPGSDGHVLAPREMVEEGRISTVNDDELTEEQLANEKEATRQALEQLGFSEQQIEETMNNLGMN